MTEPSELGDDELLARAHKWRLDALHGAQHARDHAHAHEAEVRRRFGSGVTTLRAGLEAPSSGGRRSPLGGFWRFWRFW